MYAVYRMHTCLTDGRHRPTASMPLACSVPPSGCRPKGVAMCTALERERKYVLRIFFDFFFLIIEKTQNRNWLCLGVELQCPSSRDVRDTSVALARSVSLQPPDSRPEAAGAREQAGALRVGPSTLAHARYLYRKRQRGFPLCLPCFCTAGRDLRGGPQRIRIW